MSWGPLQPARVDFADAAAPAAPDYGDLYHARAGALAQARHVFLAGNGLPGRWSGRPRFTVLETGFGLGNNLLATWQAWRDDPARCATLWYVAVEKHPLTRADLARAHARSPLPELAAGLAAHWPALTPDLHLVELEDSPRGRVRLLLAFGDIAAVLPELVLQADALYLDGFAPDRNPAMWDAAVFRALPRLLAPGATAATWCAAGAVRQALAEAGFDVDKAPGLPPKRHMTVARFAPRHRPAAPPGRAPQPDVRQVAVVGAGLAGAAAARALAGQGLAVTVLDRQPGCARETSGNPGGLVHGVLHPQDGPHARWLRAAALHAARVLRAPLADGRVAGTLQGLLRGEHALDAAAMQALLDTLALPADYVQVAAGALPDPESLTTSGTPTPPTPPEVPPRRAAWRYPDGGWLSPAAVCAHALAGPGIATAYGAAVDRLQPVPGAAGTAPRWQLLAADGRLLAEADAVVLANASDAARLGAPWADTAAAWPLSRVRGQTTVLGADTPGLPDLPEPLSDGGYALRLADGRLLCGASSQPGDEDGTLRPEEHARHLATLRRLTGWAGAVDAAALDGRVGWRLVAADKLPLVGPLPAAPASRAAAGGRPLRLEQPRQVPRVAGLYALTALGSRGLTQALLAGELLAAWITGAPWPVPAALADRLDAARFVSRALRAQARQAVR